MARYRESWSEDTQGVIGSLILITLLIGVIVFALRADYMKGKAREAEPFMLIKIESKQIVSLEDSVKYIVVSDKSTFDVEQNDYSLIKIGMCYTKKGSIVYGDLVMDEARCND
jgi:glucose uptake protein GlcU